MYLLTRQNFGYAVIAGLLVLLYFLEAADMMRDFEVFYTAGQRFINGELLYQSADGHFHFLYLPSSAFFFSFTSLWQLEVARVIWYIILSGCLFGTFYLTISILKDVGLGDTILVWPVVLVFLKYFGNEFKLGQSNLPMVVLSLYAIRCLLRAQYNQSGVSLACAVMLKPYALILLPLFIYRMQWRPVAAFFIALVIWLLLPIVTYGISGAMEQYAAWWQMVSGTTEYKLKNGDSVSFLALLYRWNGAMEPKVIYGALALVVTLGILFLATSLTALTRAPEDWNLSEQTAKRGFVTEAFLLMLLIPLISPQGWDFVFVTAIPGVFLLLASRQEFSTAWRTILYLALAVAGLIYLEILGRELYFQAKWLGIYSITFLFISTFLFQLRIRQADPAAR